MGGETGAEGRGLGLVAHLISEGPERIKHLEVPGGCRHAKAVDIKPMHANDSRGGHEAPDRHRFLLRLLRQPCRGPKALGGGG